ncbi:SDR family oxidoreductase [Brevibacterium oceani]|uniref:SDR family oxidoreductase n=1 Tax=Brevibacterium oceani TaxID=358099 RepID=UPI0031B81BA4
MSEEMTGEFGRSTVLVSGSTQGIGFASARACASDGAAVVLNGRTESAVAAAVDRLRGEVPGADVSGIAADLADMIHYGATKAASLAVANGLAKLTRGTAVTVNTVLGGPTYSDGVATTVEQIAAAQSLEVADLKSQLVRETSLLGRFIEPAEIADLVAFLAGPKSSAINGAALRAEGGVLPTLL